MTTDEQTPKRIRKRSVALMLQEALNTAATLESLEPSELSIARMKLAQTRLNALLQMQARERHDNKKLRKALEEVAALRAENAQLREQLNAETNRPRIKDVEIAEALERYERSKHVRNENEV
jgi:hypothetical protein